MRRSQLALACLLSLACTREPATTTDASATDASTSTASTTSTEAASPTASTTSTDTTTSTTDTPTTTTTAPVDPTTTTTPIDPDTGTGTGTSTTGEPTGPDVDLGDPKFNDFEFTADELDPAATLALGIEHAQLDTTVTPIGKLVVYLHGAGPQTTCGSKAHGQVLAGMGFHVLHPCYVSDYGVGNCGDDIGGCRLEAFEGVDHHPFITITPPDSLETRVVLALTHLQSLHPAGDWQYFLKDGAPRWSDIIISGISHGASTSGLIAIVREVDRAVMLSGPLDSDQAWLKQPPLTALDRLYAFTHTADPQHPGHLESFADMMLPGEPVATDGALPPYDDSHRLLTSAATGDGHSSTQAGGSSPKDGEDYRFMPVWRTMYGAP